jgi:hypothetical protein
LTTNNKTLSYWEATAQLFRQTFRAIFQSGGAMDNLDRLERLNRLRESGALTQGEFDQQKAQVLADQRAAAPARDLRWLWIAVPVVLIVAAAIVFFALNRGAGDERSAKGVGDSRVDVDANVSAVDLNSTAAAPAPTAVMGSYAWGTSADVLGVTPEFLATRLGPPRERGGEYLTYEVSGCRIYYTIRRAAVRSFSAPITAQCQPSLSGTLAANLRVSPTLTFGQIRRALGRGEYEAGLLEGFGNAADPTVELYLFGAHSNNFIDVTFSSTSGGDDGSLEGLLLWAAAVRERLGMTPQDSVIDYGPFSCARNPPANVVTALSGARVDSVEVGYQPREDCRR